jgi:DNA-binding CsgD family transcriptional regulator
MDFRILLEKITPRLRFIARRHLIMSCYDEEDLYQEMCLYLWQHYAGGLPIGVNESYVIKGCEFHIQNFLRKGRPKAVFSSMDELVGPNGATLGDLIEDKRSLFGPAMADRITIDEVRSMDLTEKERAVLSYLLKGCTVRETAGYLGVSHVMVVKYRKGIVRKWRNKIKTLKR